MGMAEAVVKVRNVVIGQGMPKICIPIAEETEGEVLRAAALLAEEQADVAEWRIDWFQSVFDRKALRTAMEKLRKVLGDIPMLVTFRRAEEGGEKALAVHEYKALNMEIADWGLADLIDVEAFAAGEDTVKEIIAKANKMGLKVIGSFHDFHGTPEVKELVRRLKYIQELGVDIPKIAVMPTDPADVLKLLAATEKMASDYADRPMITVSMGGVGLISRLAGEVFGSAMTFGAAGRSSAPGQIPIGELRAALKLINRNL